MPGRPPAACRCWCAWSGAGRQPADRQDPGVGRRGGAPRPSCRSLRRCVLPAGCKPSPARPASAIPWPPPSRSLGRRRWSRRPIMRYSTRRCSTHFLAAADVTAADVAVGLASAAVIAAAYPETRRTYIRFRDGGYSGANLFLLRTAAAQRGIEFWRRIERDRKAPWRLARAFGPVLLGAYLLRAATLNQAMRLVSRRLGHVRRRRSDAYGRGVDRRRQAGRSRPGREHPGTPGAGRSGGVTGPRIAMLSNPLSQRNRDGMASIEAVLARHPDIRHVVFEPGMDLQALLAELAAWDCGLIVLNSGDGLVHAVLGALFLGKAFATPPPLALLPRGMTNMTAADVGLGGRDAGHAAAAARCRRARRDRAPSRPPARAQGRVRPGPARRARHVLRCGRRL